MPENAMLPLTADQILKLADSPSTGKARGLLAGGRLWKFIDRLDEVDLSAAGGNPLQSVPTGHAGAYVLDRDSEPYIVLWNGDEWSCECGSEQPCVHLAALLIHLAEKYPDDSRLAIFTDNNDYKVKEVGDPRLDPQQDLLFFIEPDHLEKKSVLVLGTETEVHAALDHTAFPVTVPAEPEAAGLKFTDMTGRLWSLRPALVTLRKDGSTGLPGAWVPGGPAAPSLPDPGDIGSALLRLLSSDDSPVNSASLCRFRSRSSTRFMNSR